MLTENQIYRRIRSYLRAAALSKRLLEIKSTAKQDKNLGKTREEKDFHEIPDKVLK